MLTHKLKNKLAVAVLATCALILALASPAFAGLMVEKKKPDLGLMERLDARGLKGAKEVKEEFTKFVETHKKWVIAVAEVQKSLVCKEKPPADTEERVLCNNNFLRKASAFRKLDDSLLGARRQVYGLAHKLNQELIQFGGKFELSDSESDELTVFWHLIFEFVGDETVWKLSEELGELVSKTSGQP